MSREIKFRAKTLHRGLLNFSLYDITNYYPDDGVFYREGGEMKKLPNWMCGILGHKDLFLSYRDYERVGCVTVCLRCGKGYGWKGWIPNIMQKLQGLWDAEEIKSPEQEV